jgi:hypothetical protein
MRRGTVILATLTIALALALGGCAVLTVDVDVYKGALANHESVQTEQVAAMAMGAKPLLAELRYSLEKWWCTRSTWKTTEQSSGGKSENGVQCPDSFRRAESKASFIPQESLRSPDARRVNEILSLYEDATGQILRPLAESARTLITEVEKAKKIVGPLLFETKRKRRSDATDCAKLLAKKLLNLGGEDPKCSRDVNESHVSVIASLSKAAENTWQEAMRVLSSKESRARLQELPGDLVWDVAWIAAELTSGEGLARLLSTSDRPKVLQNSPIADLQKYLPVRLATVKREEIPSKEDSKKNPQDAFENRLDSKEEDAVEAVLAEMLANKDTGLELANQLTIAQSYALVEAKGEWRISMYPHPKYLTDPDAIFVGDLQDLLDRHHLGIALGAGRPEEGLEKLIDTYLKASRENKDSSGARGARRHLLDGLVNFAEKVTIIANFDPLIREKDSVYEEENKRYVRVLQAVGNSILSQVDALRQLETHRQDLTKARDTEVEGIRNAEARAAAVLREIAAELTAKPASFPGREDLLKAIAPGQQAMDELVKQLSKILATERAALGSEREAIVRLATANSILGRKTVQDAVDQYGRTVGAVTTAQVAQKIIEVLGKWEGEAKLPGGAGVEEARRLATTAGILGDANFNWSTTNPGPARERYLDIVKAVGRSQTVATEENAAKWATAESVLSRKSVQEAVEEYGKTATSVTTVQLAGKVQEVLGKWQVEAKLSGGAGGEEASRFATTAEILNDARFTGNTTNPGSARDKYLEILKEIGNRQTAYSKVVANLTAADAVLARKTVQDIVEEYGKTVASVTTAKVAQKIVEVLGKWEGEARLPGGAGDEEARRLQTAADVLSDPKFTGDTSDPGTVRNKYLTIVKEVNRDLVAERSKENPHVAAIIDLERWHAAARRLSEGGGPRLRIPSRVELGKDATAKDTLDVMLATLRYEHVNAMKEHGPDNQITRNLAAAVELNFAYRSGMVHILPASAYLRNSYPASIQQQDPTAGVWRNMLTDHAAHQLPLFDWLYNKAHEEDIKINNAIDKQFWQSVNQVRVSGAGQTNYAIAKDDVGNWYVKSYSSDPKDIIQSAKNLAMFSAGSAMGANFLAKGGQPEGANVPTTKEARSTLAKQFDRSTERYTDATKETRDKLKAEVEGADKRLKSAVTNGGVSDADFKKMDDAKAFAPPTGPSFDNLAKDRDAKNNLKGASALNKDIAAALLALKQYRNDVTTRLDRIPMAKENTAPDPAKGEVSSGALTKAKDAVSAAVKEILARFVKDRQTATAQYESTLQFIGEFAGAVSAPETSK